MSAAQMPLGDANRQSTRGYAAEAAWSAYNRTHGKAWPKDFAVTKDEYTAYFVQGDDDEVRDLLDRAGIYRRKFMLPSKVWAIPVGELDYVVQYARAYNGRTVIVDNEFPPMSGEFGWAS